MFKLNSLTVKNFMSVGNSTQALDFNRNDLTLVLGENLDTGGGDHGARNGTGKTTIINALSYALYGLALTNIRRDNLVNKTNGKNMLVTCGFEYGGRQYRVERGRKPNVLKFYIDGEEQEAQDTAQGDSRETQKAIEELLGMSHEMFKHVVALNTYTNPFLSLKHNDQRVIIEQLLGITLLSEKADQLKEQLRINKDLITQEEYKIKSIVDANEKIRDQIESLKRRSKMWADKNEEEKQKLTQALESLKHVDIESELKAHTERKNYKDKKREIEDLTDSLRRYEKDSERNTKTVDKLQKEIASLEDHKCYACGQELHDNKQDEILKDKKQMLTEAKDSIDSDTTSINNIKVKVAELGELGIQPEVFYDSLDDAYNHRNSLEQLKKELTNLGNQADPYAEQISEMEETGIEDVKYDTLNELTRVKEHQEFLLKLLTSKDSFIRKRIIDQNLAFLNKRLAFYLERIGLPHTVIFQNDLTVLITELGRELDFDNLSRGERNRLII